jgi:hypothetical protein
MKINLPKIMTAKYAFVILLLSLILVLSSVLVPVEVWNKQDQSNVELGLPLKFLNQDQSRLDPLFPAKVNIDSPWESPVHISLIKFSFSVIIVFIVISLILNISTKLFRLLHSA